jgi:hypothetical protein
MTDLNMKYLMAANNVKLEKIFTDELEGFLSLIWFE